MQASAWLAAQAQAEGWAKAGKLAGRSAKQGLLGIAVTDDNLQASMMELNCETGTSLIYYVFCRWLNYYIFILYFIEKI